MIRSGEGKRAVSTRRRITGTIAAAAALALSAPAAAQSPDQSEPDMSPAMPAILPLRERAALEDRWLKERLDTVVPALMREHGIDMWVLVAREYLEDPVVSTMLDATNLRARRRTILLFHDPGAGKPVERLVISKHGMGEMFTGAWDMEKQPNQWRRLADLIAERSSRKIAVNTSSLTAFADGMTHSQYTDFLAALSPRSRRASCRPTRWRSAGWKRALRPRWRGTPRSSGSPTPLSAKAFRAR